MELFYRRHRGKVNAALALFALGIISLAVNRLMIRDYTEVSLQADISFWLATAFLLGTIAMGIFLMMLEYIEMHKK